nr:uncharacterized protein LOC109177054 [Ipomoea trifida]
MVLFLPCLKCAKSQFQSEKAMKKKIVIPPAVWAKSPTQKTCAITILDRWKIFVGEAKDTRTILVLIAKDSGSITDCIPTDDRRLLSPPPRPAVAGIPSAEEPPCPALAAGLLRPSPRFEVSSVVSVAGVVGCSVHSGAVLCAIFFRFASPKARKTMTTISALLATKPVGAPFGNVEVPTRPDSLPSMQTSAMGKVLVDANKLLTAPQRRAVIGMGHPLLLGYWLLSNLDLHSMSLRLPNEVATPMDEDANDVANPMDEDAVEAVLDEKSVILNSLAGIV